MTAPSQDLVGSCSVQELTIKSYHLGKQRREGPGDEFAVLYWRYIDGRLSRLYIHAIVCSVQES